MNSGVDGAIQLGEQRIDLNAVTATYMRPYDPRQVLEAYGLSERSPEMQRVLMFEDILTSWADMTSGLVVNKPTAMAVNNSKPHQALKLRSLGFETPETIITTDPQAVLDFVAQHEEVVYKSISAIRSIVSHFTPAHRERLADVQCAPTQFQEYVKGVDYRVHVVGNEVFACRVVSKADDYRYAALQSATVEIQDCELPADVSERCVKATHEMALAVSGIDLRLTPDGKWFCFEVNSSPGYSYYQHATGQPIDEAIARLLIRGQN